LGPGLSPTGAVAYFNPGNLPVGDWWHLAWAAAAPDGIKFTTAASHLVGRSSRRKNRIGVAG